MWLAAFGIAAIMWSFARLFVPGESPIGPRRADGARLVCYGLVDAAQPARAARSTKSAFPITLSSGTNPRPNRESSEFPRLSPITKSAPSGTFVFGKSSVCCVR